jgi:hypothetical protein
MACIKREILTNARPGDAASGEHIPRSKDAEHSSKGPNIFLRAYSHSAAVTSYGKRNIAKLVVLKEQTQCVK